MEALPVRDVEDKVAVVTGAASGIGRGMAESFVAAGMKVVLSDIESAALDETTRALRGAGADVHAVRTDVSSQEEVDALAQETLRKYGAVHVLCNNAGVGAREGDERGPGSWRSPLSEWHWVVGVNLMGVVHGIRSFLPIMIEQNSEAHVVNTASLAGLVSGTTGTSYTTTKFAVVGLSENLSVELQTLGLKPKVSVLCPGPVDTNVLSAQRNRPARFATPSAPPPTAAERVLREWFAEQLKKGLSPRTVGDQVLEAIREERFYVLTHPEHNGMVDLRVKNLLSGRNPTPPAPTAETLELVQRLSAPRSEAR
jgi:NAD(P)-dependent dehydrogenase (short-subunit alcohol dehydrogenase family)